MPRDLKVLILEDRAEDAELTERELRNAAFRTAFERVETKEHFTRALQDNRPDVILSDFQLPSFDGLAALELAKKLAPGVPFIVISGTIGEERAIQVLKSGATDYVLKHRLSRLVPAVARALDERDNRLKRAQAEATLKEREEQLQQSQKMEAVGRLAGGVAHDFNNLLTVILANCSFLVAALDADDPRRADVLEIKAAGERAAWLTRHLLVFSRRHIIQRTIVDVNAVVENMERMLSRVLREDIELLTRPAPGQMLVDADPLQLEQAIMNLVVNAQDAMSEGGTLTIETAEVELDASAVERYVDATPGAYIRLSVRDTGCGMDKETRAHVFEPFFTTKDPDKGTGLGLSTVYGIIKQLDGLITVESEIGLGTIFDIHLPKRKEALAAAEDGRQAASAQSQVILLVEDNDQVRSVTKRVLLQHGYLVVEASDGAEGLRKCEAHDGPIHLVVTDIVMPHMRGDQLVECLQSLRPGLKALFVTGYSERPVLSTSPEREYIDVLHKPFNLDALVGKIRELLAP